MITTHPGRSGPNGAKGVGEAPVILPAATIGAALYDAIKVRLKSLPFDPGNLLAAMEEIAGEAGSEREDFFGAGCDEAP